MNYRDYEGNITTENGDGFIIDQKLYLKTTAMNEDVSSSLLERFAETTSMARVVDSNSTKYEKVSGFSQDQFTQGIGITQDMIDSLEVLYKSSNLSIKVFNQYMDEKKRYDSLFLEPSQLNLIKKSVKVVCESIVDRIERTPQVVFSLIYHHIYAKFNVKRTDQLLQADYDRVLLFILNIDVSTILNTLKKKKNVRN